MGDNTPYLTGGTAHDGAEPEAARTTAHNYSDSPRRNWSRFVLDREQYRPWRPGVKAWSTYAQAILVRGFPPAPRNTIRIEQKCSWGAPLVLKRNARGGTTNKSLPGERRHSTTCRAAASSRPLSLLLMCWVVVFS